MNYFSVKIKLIATMYVNGKTQAVPAVVVQTFVGAAVVVVVVAIMI